MEILIAHALITLGFVIKALGAIDYLFEATN